ncbi:band 4.1-like protein 2 isoform X2 [Xenopus tropicalis]|uniref:Band 4.1-like protein 2 isoform X2 n=1 Tax=Xenopus tropicalis TaxID=8364 RepID=A0A6I8SMM9_XENTR|nr:band 4.1-like protein 2 isoform X2 [Xenopus tropicalis]|eukprot:XP_012819128.1 PREDICTED: band 4.1-like protein 2 isoform X1 [Xenopus tropicalis]
MTTETTSGIELNNSGQPGDQEEHTGISSKESKKVEENIDQEIVNNPGETEQVIDPPSPSTSAGQQSPGKRQKEIPESKGISRFLPPWLKKQKSQSQVDTNENGDKNILREKGSAEEGSSPSQIKEEVDIGGEKDQPVAIKADDKEEKRSISTEIQPTKEDNNIDDKQKIADEKEEKQEGEKDTRDAQHTEGKKILHKTPKKMKTVMCKVKLLDGTEYSCDIEKRAKGQALYANVYEHLNLLETDYFGLTCQDSAYQKNWLDPTKEIKRQVRRTPWLFVFSVKFYPPDPSQLSEDLTRYLLCLQLRQDVSSGRLPCSFATHTILGSYTLQAELGDYETSEHSDDYISGFQFAPNQTKEMEDKIVELHKTHRGLTPAQAELQFLENAKKLSMYGVDLHYAKDSEGVDIMLGVCSNGLLIYKDRLRINRFAWPKILKISYKRSNFYIKVRPGEMEQFESTIGFKLPTHRAAKRLWKVCVEHHTFFRLSSPAQPPKAKFLTLGSKFRYSGRTQAQTREASIKIDRPAPYFERTSSKRVSRSLDGAPIGGTTDQSLLKDYSYTKADNAVDGIVKAQEKAIQEGAEVSPAKSAQFLLQKDTKSNSLRIEGENIYVRHSNLMLEDLDKTQDEILKHQASISELKRTFMESTPEPRPNEWEKRCITPVPMPSQGSLEEEITSILFSKESFTCMNFTCAPSTQRPAEGSFMKDRVTADTFSNTHSAQPENFIPRARGMRTGLSDAHENSDEMVEETKQSDSDTSEPSIAEDIKVGVNGEADSFNDAVEQSTEVEDIEKKDKESLSSSDGNSDSENEEAEYQTESRCSEDVLKEEPQETPEVVVQTEEDNQVTKADGSSVTVAHLEVITDNVTKEVTITTFESCENNITVNEEVPQDEQPKINGDVSHIDVDTSSEIICCSEPPVVKTEMVTISDATQRTEISTKEVPIVQTETKTITYESAQLDDSGDLEPGVLLSAQTITSDSVLTTTTTHITKTGKGGISETRIEKRIVISGDSDIDHDEALAQAIKEAKEQHPDMSITRVVVHKETELMEEEEEED